MPALSEVKGLKNVPFPLNNINMKYININKDLPWGVLPAHPVMGSGMGAGTERSL